MKKILLPTIIALLTLGAYAPRVFAARLNTTGFETQSVTDENLTNTSLVNALVSTTSIKRTGNASITLNNTITSGSKNGSRYIYPSSTIASTTLRFYLYIKTYPDAATTIEVFNSSTPFLQNRASLKLNTDGTLALFDSTPTQIGSNSKAIPLNKWVRVEMKVYFIASATGMLEARLDGTVFGSSNSAAITAAPGAYVLGINLGSETATAGSWYFDDLALNDNSGSLQTDYPGEGAVINLYPNEAGDFAEGASIDAQAGWQDVADHPSDGDTSYWQLQADNDRLDVGVTNSNNAGISTTSRITLVQTNVIVRNDGSAGSTFTTRLKARTGGAVTSSAAVSMISASWNVNDDGADKTGRIVSFLDPDTSGPWTPASLDTMQIGLSAPDANQDMFVTSMWAAVEFVPPPRRITFSNGRIKFTNGRINIQ